MREIEAIWISGIGIESAFKYARLGYVYIALSTGIDDEYLLTKEEITLTHEEVDSGSETEIISGNTRVVIVPTPKI
jgi:hypothetical protein